MEKNNSVTEKRHVHGILLLDKPVGLTSNQALQRVKRCYRAYKAGHTGSLDPLASGMLPICFGEATKFSQYLLDAEKYYRVTATLGVRTTTSDAEGEVLAQRAVPKLSHSKLDKLFDEFRGEIEQVPSMYSALKHNGQPLYKLARKGVSVKRKSRIITVFSLQLIKYADNQIHFDVHCSKGTYVRTLVDDFGERLGCGAHVSALRRLAVKPYSDEQMVALATIQEMADNETITQLDKHLFPIQTCLQHLPSLKLEANTAFYLSRGNAVLVPNAPQCGEVCLLQKNGQLLGIGEVQDDGRIAPRRLLRTSAFSSLSSSSYRESV